MNTAYPTKKQTFNDVCKKTESRIYRQKKQAMSVGVLYSIKQSEAKNFDSGHKLFCAVVQGNLMTSIKMQAS